MVEHLWGDFRSRTLRHRSEQFPLTKLTCNSFIAVNIDYRSIDAIGTIEKASFTLQVLVAISNKAMGNPTSNQVQRAIRFFNTPLPSCLSSYLQPKPCLKIVAPFTASLRH